MLMLLRSFIFWHAPLYSQSISHHCPSLSSKRGRSEKHTKYRNMNPQDPQEGRGCLGRVVLLGSRSWSKKGWGHKGIRGFWITPCTKIKAMHIYGLTWYFKLGLEWVKKWVLERSALKMYLSAELMETVGIYLHNSFAMFLVGTVFSIQDYMQKMKYFPWAAKGLFL